MSVTNRRTGAAGSGRVTFRPSGARQEDPQGATALPSRLERANARPGGE